MHSKAFLRVFSMAEDPHIDRNGKDSCQLVKIAEIMRYKLKASKIVFTHCIKNKCINFMHSKLIFFSVKCFAGTYRTTSMSSCGKCSENKISGQGATSCTSCGLGQVSNSQRTTCGNYSSLIYYT